MIRKTLTTTTRSFTVIGFAAVLLLLNACAASAKTVLVEDIVSYEKAVANLSAGDTIVLKNGVWNDFEIIFEGQGTEDKPITLRAENAGGVILSGNSNLRLAGEYLIVSGLVFKNGFTPTRSVISFSKSKTELANNSRVTETVIDHYNNPERYETEFWVMMYGKNNRFDHNHLVGKQTQGVTMAVRMNTLESQNNHHRIDHNYFGPRSILGSNGGETLRIGTSHHSLKDSNTTVENNYFDRCDGELEIISSKSGKNKIVGNVFYKSRGTLTMRHGNDTLVENNVFFGEGVDHTGGIRLINKRQTVRNNYLEGLAGYRFGGALVVMNGVPNSPINRYHQVEDSVIENNSFFNSDHVQLAAGSDFERSAVPIRTTFKNNLFVHDELRDPFTVYDDISGIEFSGNVISDPKSLSIQDGFKKQKVIVERADNGLLYPVSEQAEVEPSIGVSRDLSPITKDQVGVSWYEKPAERSAFDFGSEHAVKPGLDTITSALAKAGNGDILSLQAGSYSVSKTLYLDKAITLKAGTPGSNVTLTFDRSSLFEIREGGHLKLDGLTISGSESPDSTGNAVIRTQRRSMLTNYVVEIHNSNIVDLDINRSFDVLTVAKGTFADRIEIHNSNFKDISGAILGLDKESDDFGIYNAEYVTISNSSFENVQGDLVDYYRGGTDESTFGPHFRLSDSVLRNVGKGKRNKSKSALLLHGVQVTNIANNKFYDSAGFKIRHTVGEPVTKVENNEFFQTPEISVEELYSDKENTAILSNNKYVNN